MEDRVNPIQSMIFPQRNSDPIISSLILNDWNEVDINAEDEIRRKFWEVGNLEESELFSHINVINRLLRNEGIILKSITLLDEYKK